MKNEKLLAVDAARIASTSVNCKGNEDLKKAYLRRFQHQFIKDSLAIEGIIVSDEEVETVIEDRG